MNNTTVDWNNEQHIQRRCIASVIWMGIRGTNAIRCLNMISQAWTTRHARKAYNTHMVFVRRLSPEICYDRDIPFGCTYNCRSTTRWIQRYLQIRLPNKFVSTPHRHTSLSWKDRDTHNPSIHYKQYIQMARAFVILVLGVLRVSLNAINLVSRDVQYLLTYTKVDVRCRVKTSYCHQTSVHDTVHVFTKFVALVHYRDHAWP